MAFADFVKHYQTQLAMLLAGTDESGANLPLVKSEDAAHASGDKGVMALAVRTDTAAARAGTDGDYIPLIVDASGRLHVAPLPAGSNNIGDVDIATVTLPAAIYNGVKAVQTATTREALAASQALTSGVQIRAHIANTGTIYVGGATVAAANGYRLGGGESVFLEIANLATIYLDASVSGEGVSYIAS